MHQSSCHAETDLLAMCTCAVCTSPRFAHSKKRRASAGRARGSYMAPFMREPTFIESLFPRSEDCVLSESSLAIDSPQSLD